MQGEDVDATKSDGDEEDEDSSPRYYNYDEEAEGWIASDTDEVCMDSFCNFAFL